MSTCRGRLSHMTRHPCLMPKNDLQKQHMKNPPHTRIWNWYVVIITVMTEIKPLLSTRRFYTRRQTLAARGSDRYSWSRTVIMQIVVNCPCIVFCPRFQSLNAGAPLQEIPTVSQIYAMPILEKRNALLFCRISWFRKTLLVSNLTDFSFAWSVCVVWIHPHEELLDNVYIFRPRIWNQSALHESVRLGGRRCCHFG